MSFDVRLKKSTEKELKKLRGSLFIRVDAIILSLINNPRPEGTLKVQGEDNLFRIRCGNYRIIYEIDNKLKVIEVLAIVNRRDAYKRK